MASCPRCSSPCQDAHSFCFACGSSLAATPTRGPDDPLVGVTLPGGYRVTHLVGIGGMGRVYCAEQVALGRTVAVKVVHPHLAHDEMAAARFLNEARAASRLSHPNSVAIFDFGRTDDGQPYIVMEYLRGRDLARVLDKEGPLPLSRVVDVLRQTLAALEEAHALGILHRDVKPDNIVLEPLRSGLDFVKVVDFGLAKILQGDAVEGATAHALTWPGLVCGTPEYMSPEQGRGDALDGRSDLYAVGVVFFELLAGRTPFVGDSAAKTLLLHLTEPPPDPRDVAPDRSIPPAFATLALRSLAKSRDDRLQSARAFADALDRALADSEGRLSAVPTPATAIRCRACGTLSPLGQKFCGDCGASIVASGPARAPAKSSPPAAHASPASPASPAAALPVAMTTEEPAHAAQAHPPRPAPGRTEDDGGGRLMALPLLARAEALAWLDRRRREASVMLAAAHIVGDVGMGKTRLVAELRARCEAEEFEGKSAGVEWVQTGADPAWAKVSDTAVRDVIDRLRALEAAASGPTPSGNVVDGAPDAPRDLARQGLDVLFGAKPPRIAASDRRRALAEALRWSLDRAAAIAGRPLVVVVDDLDYVDGTSRNAFIDVLADPPVAPVLFVVTYAPRAHPVGDALSGETWSLEPLPYDAFANRLPQRLATRGVALSPLHLEQLIAWSRESEDPPPERLADLIARRAERLSPDARHTLHALAVWGDDAGAATLRSMLPLAVDTSSALGLLQRARIVTVDERGIRIAHPLVRRVLSSSIPAERRRELFARAAELRPSAPLEVRAKQAMHGGSPFEALALLDELSARRAAQGDQSGSVSVLRDALDVARRELHRGELDDPAEAVLVFARKLAEALAAQERWTDADGVLREALGSAPPASTHRARLLGALAHVANGRRHPSEARRYLDEALRVARQSDIRELMPMLERLDKTIAVA